MGRVIGPNIVNDGLVSCWDVGNRASYPGAGTTWPDLVGTDDGVVTNGGSFDSANMGSLVLDGTNDYIISGNTKTDFTTDNEITISIWFKINTFTDVRGLLQFAGSITDTHPWILMRTYGAGTIAWYLNGGYRITHDVDADTIYHMCLTYDSSTWKGYLNAVLDGTYTAGIGSKSGANFWIGTGYNGSLAMSCYLCRIYNRALSAADITQNYNAVKSRFGR